MPESTSTEIMNQMRAEELRRVARLLGIPKDLRRKGELIEWLSRKIRKSLPDVVRHCSENEKLALAEAAFGAGILEPQVFWGKYGKVCPAP